jgi:hypothetical protein
MKHDKIRTNCHIHITSDVVQVTAIDVKVAGSLEHTYRRTNVIMLAQWMVGIAHRLRFVFGCHRGRALRGLVDWHVR